MRLKIDFTSLRECEYDNSYYNKVQAFIYSLLFDSEYDYLHDKRGYKYFCFSNIFPIGNIKLGDMRSLIVSSPDANFIKLLRDRIYRYYLKYKVPVKIGEYSFLVKHVKVFDVKIENNMIIRAATPVVVRIPEKFFTKYRIQTNVRKYIYWRDMYPANSFIDMVKLNFIKKYIEYYDEKPMESEIIQNAKYIKTVAVKLKVNASYYDVIGSIWEFRYSYIDSSLRKSLKFIMDTGLGERNSYGFGFLNKII